MINLSKKHIVIIALILIIEILVIFYFQDNGFIGKVTMLTNAVIIFGISIYKLFFKETFE